MLVGRSESPNRDDLAEEGGVLAGRVGDHNKYIISQKTRTTISYYGRRGRMS